MTSAEDNSSSVNTMTMSARRGKGGAAYTITEECERLFCETLRSVFLGEGKPAVNPLVLVTQTNMDHNHVESEESHVNVDLWCEVWDYSGGVGFRGFVSHELHSKERTLFVFFNHGVVEKDLKQGLLALLELALTRQFSCSQLVLCVDRAMPKSENNSLMRDLGWVGFEPTTLSQWTGNVDLTSERWIFLGMEV